LNEKKKDLLSDDPHPTILETEEKEIPERKPPNDKILYFNLPKKIEELKSKEEE